MEQTQTVYSVNQYSIQTLITWIKTDEIAIPEIQRPFVWSSKQVRDLIHSLYKGYPIGYLIAWKNHDVRLKSGEKSEGKKILIDGQQRITALMASILGREVIDKNYKKLKIKISFQPMEEKFETFTPAIEKDNTWFDDISVLMTNTESLLNVVQKYKQNNQKYNQDEIFAKFQKLYNIIHNQIGLIELNSDLDVEEVTEIFIRINSKGTILSQADFVMSKIATNESFRGHQLRKLIDYFCHLLKRPEDYKLLSTDEDFKKNEEIKKLSWLENREESLYNPHYSDVLRVAFTVQFGRGRLRDLVALLSGRNFEEKIYQEEIVKNSFEKLWVGVQGFVNETSFTRFVMMLSSAGICSKELIGSINVVNYAYVVYLLLKEKKVAPQLIEKYVKKSYVFNVLMERFAGNPEGTFEFDIKRISEKGFVGYFETQEESELSDTFWDIALPGKLDTAVAASPFYRLYLIAQCSLNDKGFLSESISVRDMLLHRGDEHHIYPKNYLKKLGYKQNQYNQIANYAFTQQEINIKISDKEPQVYIDEIKKQCETNEATLGGINNYQDLKANFEMNCIPEYMLEGEIPSFEIFLKDRQKLMAKKIRVYYEKL